PASGGVGPGVADELAAFFAERGLEHRIVEPGPGELDAAARAAVEDGPDLMVVIGGDGTARAVAEICGPDGPLVAPLSAGTMSKLGHALYGPTPWRQALAKALSEGRPRWVGAGEVGGRVFYCSAILGAAALWARAREAVRAHDFGRARREAEIAYRRAFEARLRYQCDGKDIGEGVAIGFICPTISRVLDADDGALEAAVLDLSDTRAGIRLAMNYLLSDWRDDPEVSVWRCVKGRVVADGAIPAILDGEFFRYGPSVETRFRPRAFRALALSEAHPVAHWNAFA
ncbi:MAG: NAD(+)/NADH kinase, partial [Proteobacteria bacterium]|nr:NAD(+)/NADH kinase [Pseudomonadota bacterium]